MDYELIHAILGIYSIILAILGVPFNLFGAFVCLRKSLRSIPTFQVLAVLAFFDAVALCFWNVDHFLHQFFGYIQENLNLSMCRFVTFLQCVSLETSAWLLVIMSIERFLSVHVKQWRKVILNTKKCMTLIALVVGTVFLVNIHLLFTINYDYNRNATIFGECVTSAVYLTWMQVHIWLYSVVPFVLIFSSNSLLVYKILVKRKQLILPVNYLNKRKAGGITVITMTTIFLFMTLPVAVTRGFYLTQFTSNPAELTLIFLCDTLAFTYHGVNFLLLLFTNKRFSDEIKSLITSLEQHKALMRSNKNNNRTVKTVMTIM